MNVIFEDPKYDFGSICAKYFNTFVSNNSVCNNLQIVNCHLSCLT